MSTEDSDWPCYPDDNTPYDGKELFTLLQEGKDPFKARWSVQQLLQEVEENLNVKIVDIPIVHDGYYFVKFLRRITFTVGADLYADVSSSNV
jgi:hypothetical protein